MPERTPLQIFKVCDDSIHEPIVNEQVKSLEKEVLE
jgi:hypothetical protein